MFINCIVMFAEEFFLSSIAVRLTWSLDDTIYSNADLLIKKDLIWILDKISKMNRVIECK